MKKKTSHILRIALPLLLGVALVWYSLSKISIKELLGYFKNANYAYICLGLFFGLLSHLSRAYRWKYMIEPMGYTLRLGNSIMAVFTAYLVNYTIPRAGEISRATVLTNYEGVPFEKGFGTIVAERIADMIVMMGIILITLFLEFDYIYNFFIERFDPFKIAMGVVGLVVLGGLFLWFIRQSQSTFASKLRSFATGLIEGASAIFKMKHKWAFIGHTLFIWSMYILMFYVTTFALTETSNIPFAAILIAFISASFSIAATNGGIGSFPEAIVIVFVTIFGLPEDPSRAFGWIMWSSQTFMIIVLGGLSLFYLPIYNKIK
ncbi:MAG: flippase-like domain-containing protein [Algicola sp.]|nr:flippase-like domain-containing protein [Algicola sp.]